MGENPLVFVFFAIFFLIPMAIAYGKTFRSRFKAISLKTPLAVVLLLQNNF